MIIKAPDEIFRDMSDVSLVTNAYIYIKFVFSCEGAALEVLMYVHPWVIGQVENFVCRKVSECSQRFLKG